MTEHAGTETADAVAWRSFIDNPAGYAAPQRLAVCFGGAISAAACERMLATERLQARLSDLLAEQHALAGSNADDSDDIDRIVALASADDLDEVALRSGAIYWAGALAGIILAQKAAALHEALGEELCAFAVANRDLAGPVVQSLDPVEGIRERILADGWRCLSAWCHAVPAAIGMRVRLKLPPDELIDAMPQPPFVEAGPAIVRRAAG